VSTPGISRVPEPHNGPVLGYEPGSPSATSSDAASTSSPPSASRSRS